MGKMHGLIVGTVCEGSVNELVAAGYSAGGRVEQNLGGVRWGCAVGEVEHR